ncbi:hypothetical protein IAS59_000218 [Cryptococcus gattii]
MHEYIGQEKTYLHGVVRLWRPSLAQVTLFAHAVPSARVQPNPISSIQFHLHFHLRFFTATTLSINNFSGDGRAQTHSAFYITDLDRSQ